MTRLSDNNTLSKKERLKSRTKIEKVFSKGTSLFSFPIKLVYCIEPEEDSIPLLFGVTVPKRLHKKASVRNLLKRRIREAYRKNKPKLHDADNIQGRALLLMYILVDKEISDYKSIERAMMKLNHKIIEMTG